MKGSEGRSTAARGTAAMGTAAMGTAAAEGWTAGALLKALNSEAEAAAGTDIQTQQQTAAEVQSAQSVN